MAAGADRVARGKRSKRSGTRTEHRARHRLEAEGYAVTRATGSLGAWDLIAVSSRDVLLVQVKGGLRAYASPAEREALFRQLVPACGCVRKQLWRWKRGAHAPTIVEL